MKNDDLVSIIIPTYGRSTTLERAILSAEKQTYKKIEIIVVDDNNPDSEYRKNNEKLMDLLCKDYNNIIYIKHEKNKNGAAARNTGIKNSNGVYIAFLDDDDEFLPRKIEVQYNYLKKNLRYKCVGCSYKQGNNIINNNLYGDVSKAILTLEYCFTTSMLFFEKNALDNIGRFDERFIRHQDYELLLKYCKKYEIGNLEDVLLIKGKNNGENIPKGKKAEMVKKLFLETFKDNINSINKQENGFKRKVLFANYFELFVSCIKGRTVLLAIKYGFLSFVNKPFAFVKKICNIITRKV